MFSGSAKHAALSGESLPPTTASVIKKHPKKQKKNPSLVGHKTPPLISE